MEEMRIRDLSAEQIQAITRFVTTFGNPLPLEQLAVERHPGDLMRLRIKDSDRREEWLVNSSGQVEQQAA